MRCIFVLPLAVLLWVSTYAVTPAVGQTPVLESLKPNGQAEKTEPAPPDVEVKREEAAAKLRLAQRELDSAKATVRDGASPPQDKVREVDLRDQIDRVLAQQQDAQRQKNELETTSKEI